MAAERQRTSIAIQGLDTCTPDDLVSDGKCERLHNLRCDGTSWRPVSPYRITHTVQSQLCDDYTIVYHHPAAGDNIYIAMFNNTFSGYMFYRYDIMLDGDAALTFIASFDAMPRIAHFGNVLIFMLENGVEYHILHNGNYVKFSKPEEPIIDVSVMDKNKRVMHPDYFEAREGIIAYSNAVAGTQYSRAIWTLFNVTQGTSLLKINDPNDPELWTGEIALFAAYRMTDGTNIAVSPISIISSEYATNVGGRKIETRRLSFSRDESSGIYNGEISLSEGDIYLLCTRQGVNLTPKEWIDNQLYYILPTVTITISDNLEKTLYDSVAIYATRLNGIYNLDYRSSTIDINNYRQQGDGVTDSSVQSIYSDNKLPEQPFYLIKEIPISSFTDQTFAFEVTASMLSNAETSQVYTPNNNMHDITFDVVLDFNNRLHMGNVKTRLYPGYSTSSYFAAGEASANELAQYTTISKDNISYVVKGGYLNAGAAVIGQRAFKHIISYPDYRATKIMLVKDNGEVVLDVALKKSPALNVAYYIPQPTAELKYPSIVSNYEGRIFDSVGATGVIEDHNRIQVSATNNLFSLPFENSYAVGDSNNRIIAMQSAALEMSDAKFGEFPLYVFTTQGIFAMQSGSSTLYAAVVPINYDVVINNNVAAINYRIAYITVRGLHLMNNQSTQVISTPINDRNNHILVDYLSTAKIIYAKSHNEIIVYNDRYNYAYIYSLDYGYWSTRDMLGRKLNTDELYYNGVLRDITQEDTSLPLPTTEITTRAIKLGNLEFKRIETLIWRLSAPQQTAEIEMDLVVEGTQYPGRGWSKLREIHDRSIFGGDNDPLTLRRVPFSAKYYRIQLAMSPSYRYDDFQLSNIDVEWYVRFIHRMR